MATDLFLSDEEMTVNEVLGYPKAYAKICRDKSLGPFSAGPPFTFTPYNLRHQEDSRAKELDGMFPAIDSNANPRNKPKNFVSLLWKQLNHLGSAGFDPDVFRVDQYGNVLYYHADPASPLAWDIDHWFPCSRGGLTVARNLRILQWQVCKAKHNKLEFLIPWWELQVGISINQFLSIFASSKSDFRHRAFSWLFSEGESEEINSSQTVDSLTFPRHFMELKEKQGLAPAAIVASHRESFDAPLRLVDVNTGQPKSRTPIIALKKMNQVGTKENEDPLKACNPYQAIVLARDSLKNRETTLHLKAEIHKLDKEVNEIQHKTEEEKVSIQELELVLMKKKRRVEKCRRLAESQSSYRAMLEKMIRDAMHQSVVYKEQVRLNQAASSALMARLEAQKAICDSAERELHRRYEQRDELEKQTRPEWEKIRKRSRMHEQNDNMIVPYFAENEPQMLQQTELRNSKNPLCSSKSQSTSTLRKELRKFLEEEQRACFLHRQHQEEQKESINKSRKTKESLDFEMLLDVDTIRNIKFPDCEEPEEEYEDEESRKQRGKGNIEKWLKFLLETDNVEEPDFNSPNNIDESENARMNEVIDQQLAKEKDDIGDTSFKNPPLKLDRDSFNEHKEEEVKNGAGEEIDRKEKIGSTPTRSDSKRVFRRIPSSPSLIFEGMKRTVDCIGKKPLVLDDKDSENDAAARNGFIKTSINSIKKAVKL